MIQAHNKLLEFHHLINVKPNTDSINVSRLNSRMMKNVQKLAQDHVTKENAQSKHIKQRKQHDLIIPNFIIKLNNIINF